MASCGNVTRGQTCEAKAKCPVGEAVSPKADATEATVEATKAKTAGAPIMDLLLMAVEHRWLD